MTNLTEFWSILAPRRRLQMIKLCFFMITGSILEFASVSAIPIYVVAMARSSEIMNAPGTKPWLDFLHIRDAPTLLYVGGAAVIILFLVRGAFNLVILRMQASFVADLGRDLALRLFNAYIYSPYWQHLAKNSSHFNHMIMNETHRVVNFYAYSLLLVIQSALVMFALACIILVSDPFLAIVIFLIGGSGSYLFMRINRERSRTHGAEYSLRSQRLIQTIHEALGSFKHTRLRGLEETLEREFDGHLRIRDNAHTWMRFNQGLPKPLFETVGLIALILVVFALLLLGRPIDTIVPTLAMLGTVTVRTLPTLNTLISQLSSMRSNAVAVSAIASEFHRLGITEYPAQPSSTSVEALPMGDIEFRNVTFRYPGQHHDALRNLSLSIPAGSSVAFVGPTGSGKTTAVDVMLGFLTTAEGEITVGGRPITDNLSGWQRHIGYIPQAIFLTDASIRRNVALGLPDDEVDDEAVWHALEAAQLADYVRALPDGLATNVGERGVRLSGGQRQRIGIARALYHSPTVLVLDEATAALDNSTETRLMAAIEQAKHGRTLVMIAHRLSTVRNCDCIFFLSAGEVIASGTYDELVADCAEFRLMANLANGSEATATSGAMEHLSA